MCPHHKVGRVKPTYISVCPTKPGWLCSPFAGAVWNNTYSFSSAQHSSLQGINSLSVQLLTPCCAAANDPKNITKNIYIPLHLLLHYFLSRCSLSLPAQKFAERECLSPCREKPGKRCGNKRISQGGDVWGVYIPVLKSALGKLLFKLCLQKAFPDVFPGTSWCLTNVKWY